jgi:chromate transporter
LIQSARSEVPSSLPTFAEATRTWLRIGLLSFGGPAGQIAVMHRVLVEEKRWIDEPRFMHALNYCMLLPGPEAQQLATYVGWLLHGVKGGIVSGVLFVLPGFLAMMALSIAYVTWQHHPLVDGLLLGLKAAVIALVFEALLRVARRALTGTAMRVIAIGAFLALATLHLPFPLVIVAAGLGGFAMAVARRRGGQLAPESAPIDTGPAPGARRLFKLLAIWVPLWLAPVIASAAWLGTGSVFTQLGAFFGKLSVVTFGGAYAALSWVAQEAVGHNGWISPAQMVDGLGLAESTPGPLVLVFQFVGFLAAYQSGSTPSLAAGVGGALIVVWMTFTPSFLWIFAGAPYVERMRHNPLLTETLRAVTAAVVGVIASLGLWFALHVLFARLEWFVLGPVRLELPEPGTLRLAPTLLAVLALVLLLVLKQGIGRCIALCALLGVVITQF